jgi:hypothetical protein
MINDVFFHKIFLNDKTGEAKKSFSAIVETIFPLVTGDC